MPALGITQDLSSGSRLLLPYSETAIPARLLPPLPIGLSVDLQYSWQSLLLTIYLFGSVDHICALLPLQMDNSHV